MSFDYVSLGAEVSDVITELGRPITLRHPTESPIPTRGVFVNAEANVATPGALNRRGATIVEEQHAFFIVPDVGVELDTDWFIDDGGKRREIARVLPTAPGPTTVVNQLFVVS